MLFEDIFCSNLDYETKKGIFVVSFMKDSSWKSHLESRSAIEKFKIDPGASEASLFDI